MNDPQVVEITVGAATQFTKLVAAYGIYAILILFMFYQQSRERKCLAEAKTPKQEAYYRKRASVVLGFTIALALLSSGTWFYATFLYKPKIVIEGQVTNLREQKVMPARLGDPPRVTYHLDAYTSDGRFYSGKLGEESIDSATGDLEWALTSRRGFRTLHLIFKREFSAIKSEGQDFQIATLGEQPPLPKIDRSTIKHATIRFPDLQELLDDHIVLEYKPNPDVQEIGSLILIHEGGTRVIPWASEDGGGPPTPTPDAKSAFLGMGVAWAEEVQPTLVFGPRGEVSEEVYKNLKVFLESEDLKHQILARDTLVHAGVRAFPAMERLLGEPAPDPNSRSRLVHNVAAAIERMESSQNRVSPNLSLKLAQSLFKLGDYELAAEYFSRIPDSQELPLYESHQRGLSYLNAGRYDEAEKVFVHLLQETGNESQRSAITTNLGTAYSRGGKWKDAITAYRRALAMDPKNVTAIYNLGSVEMKLGKYADAEKLFKQGYEVDSKHPLILNGLAYSWAQQGKNLDTALSHVEKALATNPENPQFLDTKGWVLYKRGQTRLASEFLEKALRKDPESEEIRDHVETVRRQLNSASARPGGG